MPETPPDRRALLQAGLAAGAAAAIGAPAAGQDPVDDAAPAADEKPRFGLHYATHFGMFRHHAGDDLVDQIRFMHDEGFTALEDNGMRNRSPADQERVGAELERLGMKMGVFVCNWGTAFGKDSFTSGKQEHVDSFVADCEASVETAKRCGATWCTVVLGDLHRRIHPEFQFANAIDMLRRGAEVCEPHGLVMVLEPLNPYVDHAGMFLARIPQAYAICRAVNSPSVKILNDLYHQQIAEGHLIPNIDAAWDEIAYYKVGDNPGRKEPTTGEINYLNVFRHLKRRGFEGVVGMEHGNSKKCKEGERAVIDAYKWSDC